MTQEKVSSHAVRASGSRGGRVEERAIESPVVGKVGASQRVDRRLVRRLLVLVGVALAITLAYSLVGPRRSQEVPCGTSSFSRSAVGYSALVEMLDAAGVPVLSSQSVSAQRVSEQAPLVLLEPLVETGEIEILERMIDQARAREAAVILVLPRWSYVPSDERPGWISGVDQHPLDAVVGVLRAGLERRTSSVLPIRRLDEPVHEWHGALDQPVHPALRSPQLIDADQEGVQPLIWSAQGSLAVQVQGSRTLIISDPGLLDNAGLGLGDNAVLAYRLLVELFDSKALVIDETLHGYRRVESLWDEVLQPPLVLVPIQLCLILLAAIWAGLVRLGRPVEPEPRMSAGPASLVESGSRLIVFAGVTRETLIEYWKITVRKVAAELGVAVEAGPGRLIDRQARLLARLGRARMVGIDIESLTARIMSYGSGRIDPRQAIALARDLFRWRKEMLNGPESDR